MEVNFKIFSIVSSSVNRAETCEANSRCSLVEEIHICEMNVGYSWCSGLETLTDVSCYLNLKNVLG